MLWEIKGSNSYLLGSLHLLDQPAFTLTAAALRAFNKADQVIFESAPAVPSYAFSNEPLSSRITGALFKRVEKMWIDLGQRMSSLEFCQTWFAAMILEATQAHYYGISPEFGVEEGVRAAALKYKKPCAYLEGPEDGFRALASAPESEHIKLLEYVSEPSKPALYSNFELIRYWRLGQIEGIKQLYARDLDVCPQGFTGQIEGRTLTWLPKVLSAIEGKSSSLVVVGITHCIGRSGLPSLLQENGYRVSRLRV